MKFSIPVFDENLKIHFNRFIYSKTFTFNAFDKIFSTLTPLKCIDLLLKIFDFNKKKS